MAPRLTMHGVHRLKVSLRKRLWRNVRGHFRSRVLSCYGVAILAETKNGTLAVDPADFNVSRQLLTRGEYDWKEVQLLSRLLNRTSRVAVVGAHIGAVLIPLVRMAEVRSAMAYEPSPRNFKLLQINLAQSGLSQVVEAKNIAVGERSGRARFTENRINTGNSRLTARGGNVEVALETLDATIPDDWDSIDLIAMDVEGAEVRAMRGATRTLKKTKCFYVEFAPEQLHEQGSTVSEFIDLTAAHFNFAYLSGATPRQLDSAAFTKYLRELPPRRGLLLNILFSKESANLTTLR
jgi:FkbM family methyltransferase